MEACAKDARVAQQGEKQMIKSLHSMTVWREKKKSLCVCNHNKSDTFGFLFLCGFSQGFVSVLFCFCFLSKTHFHILNSESNPHRNNFGFIHILTAAGKSLVTILSSDLQPKRANGYPAQCVVSNQRWSYKTT